MGDHDKLPHYFWWGDTLMAQASRAWLTKRLHALVTAMELGGNIRDCIDGTLHDDALTKRVRDIRDDLVELDLYRFHFGELPVEMQVDRDPLAAFRGNALTIIVNGSGAPSSCGTA